MNEEIKSEEIKSEEINKEVDASSGDEDLKAQTETLGVDDANMAPDKDSEDGDDNDAKDILDLPLPVETESANKNKHIRDRLLTKKAKELERVQAEKEELLRIVNEKGYNQQLAQQSQEQNIRKPSRDDFDDDDDYIDARIQYNENIKARKMMEQASAQRTHAMRQQVINKIEDMNERGSSKYDDYEELVYPIYDSKGTFPANEGMAAAIFNSKYDVDINYFLAKNIKHAHKIASLPPIQAQKKIWEIERRFSELKKKPQAKAGTKIIEPISTSSGSGSSVLSKMSEQKQNDLWENDRKEFNRLYNEEKRSKKRY